MIICAWCGKPNMIGRAYRYHRYPRPRYFCPDESCEMAWLKNVAECEAKQAQNPAIIIEN